MHFQDVDPCVLQMFCISLHKVNTGAFLPLQANLVNLKQSLVRRKDWDASENNTQPNVIYIFFVRHS